MRTDSTRIADEARDRARAYVTETFGEEFVPKAERKTKAAKGAQDAHEAIRPTDAYRTPESVAAHLSPEQLKLYRLVWRRFLASQMASAILDVMVVDVTAGAYTLRANGQRVKFPGYLSLSPDRQESAFLPPVNVGDVLDLHELQTDQHFTQPAARYTEGTLVKALESRGIGRPSTYAPTISTIIDRRYVFLEDRKFHPTGLGMVVTEQLEKHFAGIIDPDFTAKMEGQLDAVESGEEPWDKVLGDFYTPFEKALGEAAEHMERIKVPDVPLDQMCPQCGKQLALREGRYGRFVACTGFPECTYRAQEAQVLATGGEATGEDGEAAAPEVPQVDCELCGAPMTLRKSRRGPFLGCSRYPECKSTRPIAADGTIKPAKAPAEITDIPCEKCGKPMVIRSSRRGKFLGCSGFPKCRGTKQLPAEAGDEAKGEGEAPAAE
jgi:DNA topoisomerase-1